MSSRVKGPNKVNHYYMPSYHARNAEKRDEKTRFIIKENEEYDLFNLADEHEISPICGNFDLDSELDYTWINDDHEGLFSVKRATTDPQSKLEIVGENGERFAFFPSVTNMTDAWHGYPVKASNIKRPLGPRLMAYLNKLGYLSKIDVKRIKCRLL